MRFNMAPSREIRCDASMPCDATRWNIARTGKFHVRFLGNRALRCVTAPRVCPPPFGRDKRDGDGSELSPIDDGIPSRREGAMHIERAIVSGCRAMRGTSVRLRHPIRFRR
jgi:hypothetical protein